MSVNLVVWKWRASHDSAAKRHKLGLKMGDVTAAFCEEGDHAAFDDVDFAGFEAAVVQQIGPEVTDGPYLVERYPRARVYNLPNSQVPDLVMKIGLLARKHGLTSAEG